MWILILTLFGGYNATSPTVTQVGPFKTESGCEVAAEKWEKMIQKDLDVRSVHIYKTCVHSEAVIKVIF